MRENKKKKSKHYYYRRHNFKQKYYFNVTEIISIVRSLNRLILFSYGIVNYFTKR